MLKDIHNMPVMVNCQKKVLSRLVWIAPLLSCRVLRAVFAWQTFGIKTKETTDVSHSVLTFLSGRVAVDKF